MRNKPKPKSLSKPRSKRRGLPVPQLPADAQEQVRTLFWQNVVREMLTNFAMLQAQANTKGERLAILDGRVAVITRTGVRLGIAEVTPLFACGIPGTPAQQALSMAVECTVFRIVTPEGEVWTLPLSEITGVHALSEGLVKQLQEASTVEAGGGEPFGFAAFTSLAASAPAKEPL